MSTDYQIKEINLNDFEKVGDVEIKKYDDVTVIEFSSPFGYRKGKNKVIFTDNGHEGVSLRRFGGDTNENDIKHLIFITMCITGRGSMIDDYGFQMGFPSVCKGTHEEVPIETFYEETTNRNKSFYDLDIRDQYESMLANMSKEERTTERYRFEGFGEKLESYLEKYYPEMLTVKTRGYGSREEEVEMFLEYFTRYEGESINMDGESVTSDDDLIARDANLKEINKFWDDHETFKGETMKNKTNSIESPIHGEIRSL